MSLKFGTDGLRGRANVDLTPELAVRVGLAAGQVLGGEQAGTMVVGRDTRKSGAMLEAAVASGLASAGWQVRLAGVMTSPGVACLATLLGAGGGCVISASHNPAPDNGIKFFSAQGAKLAVALEKRIEALLADECWPGRGRRRAPGAIRPLRGAVQRYGGFLRQGCRHDLSGMRLLLDCANGAASRIAPALFRSFGAAVTALNDRPNGSNINDNCGATHPEALAAAVVAEGAHVGIAFDGDADRVIFVDERGCVRNGDHALYVIATQRRASGALPGDGIVGTVMSNLGTERALKRVGIRLERANVGDRDVYARMRETGLAVGGEQSGHITLLDRLNTGDGILTALEVLAAVRRAGETLSELCAPVQMFPQVLINIPLRDGLDWRESSPLGLSLKAAESLLLPEGRVLVRRSGTEPILRVMLESPRVDALFQAADGIELAAATLGARRQLLSTANGE